MFDYLVMIVFMDVIALFLLSIITLQNQLISNTVKRKYIFTYICVALVSLSELFSLKINGIFPDLRILNIILSALGFILAPLIPIMLGSAIFKFKYERLIRRIWTAYGVFILMSLPFGWIFKVDAMNIYCRGPLFFIFIFMYCISAIYYVILMIRSAEQYQRKSAKTIILLAFCFFFETSVQVIDPSIQLSWMAVTLLVIINYIYFNTLWQQIDGMTSLLNQQSYITACRNNRKNGVMLFMDVDKFKFINDEFGHKAGNEVLIHIACMIKEIYGKYGVCYRVGGDEFSVLLNAKINYQELNKEFKQRIDMKRQEEKYFPNVSVGCVPFTKEDNLDKIFELADLKMYQQKEK